MMNDDFFTLIEFRRTTLDDIATLLAHWREKCTDRLCDDWELEVRLGTIAEGGFYEGSDQLLALSHPEHQFDTTIDPGLFLGIFHYLCQLHDAVSISLSEIDYVTSDERWRTVHYESEHKDCKTNEKKQHRAPNNFKRLKHGLFDLRLANSVEMLPTEKPVCQSVWPPIGSTKRHRRSIFLRQAECWRIDFTRIDDGLMHRIEIELQWHRAYMRIHKRYIDSITLAPPLLTFEEFLSHVIVSQLLIVINTIERAAHVAVRMK